MKHRAPTHRVAAIVWAGIEADIQQVQRQLDRIAPNPDDQFDIDTIQTIVSEPGTVVWSIS
ncbi:hypothetical protein HF690_12430 [Oleiagrimonas citrea]|uniref:Uncharacterized protein n=1 Tax=Oleiagrimonas citrea TaxID=1665687 RepID=A0A846ZNE5_9GAMM|nr:hypothetical protein [Oleiagrimonas citrea]